MSKEAVGQNGAVLGSFDYWDRLNRSTYIGTAMQRTSEPEYFEAVKRIGQRAASAIGAIYDDLQKNKKAIHNITFSDRNAVSRQVQALRTYVPCQLLLPVMVQNVFSFSTNRTSPITVFPGLTNPPFTPLSIKSKIIPISLPASA